MSWFRERYHDLLLAVMIWCAARIWPVMNIYAPGAEKLGDDASVKAMIFADSEETLNKIVRGWTNPDADHAPGREALEQDDGR